MSKRKLKVVFIHPDLGIGGAERLILDVAEALSKQGHSVKFITNHFDETHAFDELKDGEYPVDVYGDWLPRSLFGMFHALCAYIRMIYLSIVYLLFFRNKDKPDIYFVDLIPTAIPFLKLTNEPVIYYCHHPDLLSSTPGGKLKKIYRMPINWLELKATAQADVILVNSEYTASIFRSTFPEIRRSIHVLYPTIAFTYQQTVQSLKTMKPIDELIPEIKTKNNIIFLSLNRFHPAKKLEMAILAMEKLKMFLSEKEWKSVYLIMAGGYDPQSNINAKTFSELVNLTQEKYLQDKVLFVKSPTDKLKADLLNSCTCLIYTPVNEHFGIVPLEAMLVSKPVIAVNSGGPRETVDHGITGYLCEPTAESMAQFMYRIISEKDSCEMGAKGKIRLEQKFSNDSFSACLRTIISEATVNLENKRSK